MGSALLGGLLDAQWCSTDEVVVIEPLAGRRDELAAHYDGLVVVAEPVDGVADAVIATKPEVVAAACGALAGAGVKRVLSIAAGVATATIEQALGGPVVVVRAMPNTPALLGAGASAVAVGASGGDDDLAWAEEVLGAVGVVVRTTESQLDAVTGLSGSGPAYVFLLAEALIEAGVLNGLTRPDATTLALHTVGGAARLLLESTDGPEVLRAGVTSPGGTTAAGLRVLEHAGFRAAVLDAVTAATERSRELSAG